jgi:hypothetical protein
VGRSAAVAISVLTTPLRRSTLRVLSCLQSSLRAWLLLCDVAARFVSATAGSGGRPIPACPCHCCRPAAPAGEKGSPWCVLTLFLCGVPSDSPPALVGSCMACSLWCELACACELRARFWVGTSVTLPHGALLYLTYQCNSSQWCLCVFCEWARPAPALCVVQAAAAVPAPVAVPPPHAAEGASAAIPAEVRARLRALVECGCNWAAPRAPTVCSRLERWSVSRWCFFFPSPPPSC